MNLKTLGAMAGLVLALLLPAVAAAAPFTFTLSTLPPGGHLAVQPGQLAGWGYTLDNTDSVNWFVPTGLSASSFSLGTPDAGYFDFPILAPGASASAIFDPVTLSGLYGVQVFNSVVNGQSDSGFFMLTGQWWSANPLAGGVFIQNATAVLTPFSLTVGTLAVPLPGTLLLFGPGLLLLLLLRQRRPDEGQQVGAGLG
ncbi:hypothetical protein [Janthinobacterium agaricidamnosum]|uniref:PEP-CTERM exosortase interaction domain protein n=1 Tax=Janthinobacterium agaricidamnosum NBRC 102515 = DSM 9628 TaxID=1349767 RepID=W0V5Z5_9BURK|nr:hypothetical protein [Janthinobacterium agaricidamnosum]CDG83000.1 hypothetical protein GJA_2366 [Janthinobacterium agaricidamnosum NBRC 102515 = DSM 9628]